MPAYISVLHVNSLMGIEQVFPYQDAQGIQGLDDAMLKPGESRIEGPFECNGEGESSFGQRNTIVLATRGAKSLLLAAAGRACQNPQRGEHRRRWSS